MNSSKVISPWAYGRLAALLLLLFWWQLLSAQDHTEFDEHFQLSTNRYLWGLLPDDDWIYWKAQCWQESLLDLNAVSHAGASGVCQLMPAAAQDAELAWVDRFDARKNILAGAKILRRNIKAWWPRDTRFQRLQLAWGAYNWGLGNMLKAQNRCNGGRLWGDIRPCVTPLETRHYVEVIPKHYKRFSQ